MDNIFDAIVIDTSALEQYQFDFCGITSKILPSFFEMLKERGVKIINHPVLDQEIKKHIKTSNIIERVNGLKISLIKNKDFFPLIGISTETALENINKLNLIDVFEKQYNIIYQKAIMLDYSNPKDIFKSYFDNLPPFSKENNKKSEFPDAFIIDAVKNHINKQHFNHFLIISQDDDWRKAFESVERITFCKSVDETMSLLLNSDKIMPIINDNMDSLLSNIQDKAECECFDIPELGEIDSLDISNIIATEINYIVPLKITKDSIIFKCDCQLLVDGSARYFDEDASVYDSEDKCYVWQVYKDIKFEKAEADISCEVEIQFSADIEDWTCYDINSKILNHWDINLDLKNATVEETECDEDDLSLESLREDKLF